MAESAGIHLYRTHLHVLHGTEHETSVHIPHGNINGSQQRIETAAAISFGVKAHKFGRKPVSKRSIWFASFAFEAQMQIEEARRGGVNGNSGGALFSSK